MISWREFIKVSQRLLVSINYCVFLEVVRETGGYMTKDGKVHLHRVEAVMRAIGRMEDNIFKKRREDECRRRIRDEKRKQQNRNHRRFGDSARNAPAQSGIQVLNPTLSLLLIISRHLKRSIKSNARNKWLDRRVKFARRPPRLGWLRRNMKTIKLRL